MEELLVQLSELFLHAIPTAGLLLLVWTCYRVIVHKRLVAVLAERRQRTVGAMAKARADISAAEARTAEYERRIREAKIAVYKAQEARRRQQLEVRAAAVAEARAAAEARVHAERQSLQADLMRAKASLQAEVEALANAIIRTVLKSARAAETPVAGGLE